ncbi:hypothetical protein [Deinococcus misasensis]|uniref:hypothetical protein n=1 Tax=Deinococcus misasensis TaxID=392413 RepID=UPI000557BFCA|nr:hypothetical protein [Deinococcus misasensis]
MFEDLKARVAHQQEHGAEHSLLTVQQLSDLLQEVDALTAALKATHDLFELQKQGTPRSVPNQNTALEYLNALGKAERRAHLLVEERMKAHGLNKATP